MIAGNEVEMLLDGHCIPLAAALHAVNTQDPAGKA